MISFRFAPPFVCLVLLAAAACGASGTPLEPDPASVGGAWALHASASGGGVSCTHRPGSRLQLVQNGRTLSGSYTAVTVCSTPGGTVEQSGTVPIEGRVDGDSIFFRIVTCSYSGRLSGTPPASAGGRLSCTGSPPIGGEWTAERVAG